MLQEETIKKITEVMQPLVKLNIFTQEEIDALQRVNEPAITMQKKKDETPEKIPELYTLAETAKMLKITIKGVYDLVKSGKSGSSLWYRPDLLANPMRLAYVIVHNFRYFKKYRGRLRENEKRNEFTYE